MKKIVSLFLALVMLVSTVAVSAFADTPNLSMSVDKSVVNEGENVVITVSVRATTVSSLAGTFSFDKDAFECVSIAGVKNGSEKLDKAYLKNDDDDDIPATALSTIEEANRSGNVGVAFAGTNDANYLAGVVFKVTLQAKTAKATEFKLSETSAGKNRFNADPSQTLTITVKSNHEHTYTKVGAVAATCVKDGNIEYYTCTCGKYFKLVGENYVEISQADTVISKSTAAHQMTHVDAVVPTNCSTDAVKGHWKCTVCGKLFTDEAGNNETTLAELTTPANHLNIESVAKVDATCTTDGMKAHYKCSACGKLFTDKDGKNPTTEAALKIPAAHKLSQIAKKNATCTEDGMEAHYQCSVCKKLFTDKDGKNETTADALKIPAAHNIFAVAKKDATCTVDGYEAHYKCTVCKQLFSDKDGKNPIDAPVVIKAAHKPVKVEAKPSTCLAEGWTEHYKCSVCGQLFSDAAGKTSIAKVPTLPLASHTAASSAYVSDANNHWQLCQWCGLKINEAGHTWNKPATEDDAVYCTTCGYVKTAAKTPCKEHTPGGLVADEAYHYTFCITCGEQVTKEGHTYGEATTVDGKKVEVCTKCGYVKTTTTAPITPVNPGKPGKPGSNTGSKPVQSQKTFDAGIALYAGMAVLSLTGSAWMITKKKKEH